MAHPIPHRRTSNRPPYATAVDGGAHFGEKGLMLFRHGRCPGPRQWITLMLALGATTTLLSASLFAVPAEVRVPIVKEHGKADPPAAGRFSHWRHDQFQCFDCHPALFPRMRKGFTHEQMDEGKFCGACHDGKAAPPTSGARAVCKTSCHMP